MEDGENGAKRLWNGYIREKSSIFSKQINDKDEKVLELGREKKWRSFETTVLQDFLRQIDW